MQGKKNNLPPKAPEPYILDETFTGLFKSDKPKYDKNHSKSTTVLVKIRAINIV